jgi:carboxyl-terminal processing protease
VTFLKSLGVCAALLCVGMTAHSESLRDRMNTFDLVWRRVQEKHYDPKFGGVDWNAVRKQYAPRVRKVKTDAEFYGLLNEMLGELKQSHFGVIPPSGSHMADDVAASHEGELGLTVQLVEGQAVITQIEEGSSAAESALKPGFVLSTVNGKPVDKLLARIKSRKLKPVEERFQFRYTLRSQLGGTIGSKVKIGYLDGNNAAQTVELEARKPKGEVVRFGYLPPIPSFVESKRLPGNIGYVRLNIFMIPLLEPVKKAVAELHDTDGMIIDLRGNLGGVGMMAPPIAGLFSPKSGTLGTMKMRTGEMRFAFFANDNAYTKPLVVLTDEGSVSTSEILAGSLQENRRALTVGSATPGMVLPSNIERLPRGVRMQYVIADFKTPKGILLEGRGVLPDIPVKLTRKSLLEEGDPILKAATDAIQKQRGATSSAASQEQNKP